MDLQILVNHYKEDNNIVQRFLDSLAMQKDVDFEVILFTDGGVELEENIFQFYSFPIIYKHLPHSGVCHTRNLLLKEATAKYIIFCDVDDCFSSPYGLSVLMQAIKQTDADIIGANYFGEIEHNGRYLYIPYEKDIIRLHAKIFKREYLLENNIWFPDEMEISGDMNFLWLAYNLTSNIKWLKNNFYIWKHNSNSVTRTNSYHKYVTYEKTLKCYTLLLENLKKRERLDLYDKLIAIIFMMCYIDVHEPQWNYIPKEYQDIALKNIKNFVLEYGDKFFPVPDEIKKLAHQSMFAFRKMEQTPNDIAKIEKWIKEFNFNLKTGNDVLIIGYGVVGHNLANELKKLNPDIYDKYKDIDARKKGKYAIAFICVDTPLIDNSLNVKEVYNALNENDADIYIIKSTVLPGTTDMFKKELNKHIIFSPEYYGGTQHCNNFDFNFTILGGEKEDCGKAIQILQKVYDGRHQFRITDSKTAELTKFMENSYLATKVSFCNQFNQIAEELGIQYEELRELFILDPRVNESHTFVYKDKPYWDSHCLNKDVPAIAEAYNAQLLKNIIEFNNKCKDK